MDALRRLRGSPGWRAAEEALRGPAGALVRRTPLLPSPPLAPPGWEAAFIKAEGLQRTGSFKVRGAVARIASLAPSEARAGVVTASAGNHGLGVACAARALGIRATVVVPTISPEVKRAGIAALGAEVVVQGEGYDAAERRARFLAAERGATYLPAFDDDVVIAGNGGSLGREIARDLPGGPGPGDVLVVPVGGGGLASGLAGALAGTGTTLVGVEPERNCAMRLSLERGAAVTDYPEGGPTIAEGLEGSVSERTFAVCREALAGVVLVSEDALLRAMAWAFRRAGLVLEPSAAASVAAVLEGRVPPGRRVVCVATGSNVDPALLDAALRDA